jgi:hypothetical protein
VTRTLDLRIKSRFPPIFHPGHERAHEGNGERQRISGNVRATLLATFILIGKLRVAMDEQCQFTADGDVRSEGRQQRADYLNAQYTTPPMKFVDDVEFCTARLPR